MSTHSHVSSRRTAALAVIFLLPALILFILWSSIGLRYSGIGPGEQMDNYMSYFPSWLQNMNTLQAISIVSCILAIVFAARSFKKRLLSVRVLMLMTVLIAIFILLFDIYQIV